jgi:hypothetical protein
LNIERDCDMIRKIKEISKDFQNFSLDFCIAGLFLKSVKVLSRFYMSFCMLLYDTRGENEFNFSGAGRYP